MAKYKEAFIGIDTAKSRNAVAVADGRRGGEVRYFGEVNNTPEGTRRLVAKLVGQYRKLTFCYEAGPTGYGLYRQIRELGHDCIVVAPSLIPIKPGDRVKTNRRDAEMLAKLLRADELTAVWVPDQQHEAMRDLVRARDTAVKDVRAKRQQVTSFLLRHGRSFPERTAWSRAHARWLAEQSFSHPAQQYVLQEGIEAVRAAENRLIRIEQAMAEAVPNWSLAPLAEAIQAMRGINFISAVTFLAEVGDLTRFDNPRRLMAYLGLVPSERSTGDNPKRGRITKAGNIRARRTLIESAWTYRFPARIGAAKLAKVEAVSEPIRAIAWKAQTRLCTRYRSLTAKGKKTTVATTAVAREMAAFIWAIAQQVMLQDHTATT